MLEVAVATADDAEIIETLLDNVFGAGRQAKASYQFRAGVAPVSALSLVAKDNNELVGSIQYWPMSLGDQTVLLLGPLAIALHRQKQGIGRMLTEMSLGLAEKMGFRVVFLVGDPGYYQHLGFVPAPRSVTMPHEDPARLQVRCLSEEHDSSLAGELCIWHNQPVSEPHQAV